jgi:hypothetical protein
MVVADDDGRATSRRHSHATEQWDALALKEFRLELAPLIAPLYFPL